MPRLFFTASLVIIISLIWLKQNPHMIEAALAIFSDMSSSNNNPLDSSIQSTDKPSSQGLQELPYLYQTIPNDQNNASQQNGNVKSTRKIPKHTPTIQALNLSLPSTIHPASPALSLPERQKLILEPQKEKPAGVSIGGGIDWDEKTEKAKGVKISITVPTG